MPYALPEHYDALYAYKDYPGEAARIVEIVLARNREARTLLDVACGTGRHLEHLRETFDVEGVDLDLGLLTVARARLDSVTLRTGDMRTLELGRRFDVVTCLFSAIGHLADTDELHASIAAMAAHLEPGGILIVEPWIEPDAWTAGRPDLLTVDEPDLKIARVTLTGRRGDTSLIDFRYLVATPDGIEAYGEQMELALFTAAEMCGSFEGAGLDVEHDADGLTGRGLYIGRSAGPS